MDPFRPVRARGPPGLVRVADSDIPRFSGGEVRLGGWLWAFLRVIHALRVLFRRIFRLPLARSFSRQFLRVCRQLSFFRRASAQL